MGKESASFWAGIKKYEDILAGNPNAYSFAPLAEIYRKLGLPDEALQIARRGVTLHPEFAAGQMVLAASCLDKNMVAEARQALETVVRITPENLVAQKLLADIYQAAGNSISAANCLKIIAELEPYVQGGSAGVDGTVPAEGHREGETTAVPAAVLAETVAVEGKEYGGDVEILELSDDLIEEEIVEEEPYSHFAAAPPRPSLLVAKEESEPAAAFSPVERPPASVATGGGEEFRFEEAAPSADEAVQPPVLSATIAELYISQGFIDKGVNLYAELLRENPDNSAYRMRYTELTGKTGASGENVVDAPRPAAAEVAMDRVPVPAPGEQDQVSTMEGWLNNIRRIRECRTETL